MRDAALFLSLFRAVQIAVILAASLAIALFVGLMLADLGMLGTCQDGTCQLVAAIYVMPLGGLGLYVAALIAYSVVAARRNRIET